MQFCLINFLKKDKKTQAKHSTTREHTQKQRTGGGERALEQVDHRHLSDRQLDLDLAQNDVEDEPLEELRGKEKFDVQKKRRSNTRGGR